MPAHFVVVGGVVDVLDGHHPDAEQQPQWRGNDVDHGDPRQDEQADGAGQEVAQLAHFAAQGAGDHFDQFGPAESREVVSAAQHHFDLFREEAVEGRGDDVGDHGEGEEHHQHDQHHEQRPEDVIKEAQPAGQAPHERVHPEAEFVAGEIDECAEQHQVDAQRQQDEQAQAGAQDQFQALAQVLRAGQGGCGHRGLQSWKTRRPYRLCESGGSRIGAMTFAETIWRG